MDAAVEAGATHAADGLLLLEEPLPLRVLSAPLGRLTTLLARTHRSRACARTFPASLARRRGDEAF